MAVRKAFNTAIKMKSFHEGLRYEYPELTAESLIIDAGGFEGNWFKTMFERYKCNVVVYEPAYAFWLKCSMVAHELNPDASKIKVNNWALGGSARTESFMISGDASGMFAPEGKQEKVVVFDASNGGPFQGAVDVLKLNIEGMEFEVLESLIAAGVITKIKNIQVQFHNCVPDYENRYRLLREQLVKTHEPEWGSEPVWQNFRLR
jgi:FkbM family methyltransferase